jgi:glycine C-acetyltransferase
VYTKEAKEFYEKELQSIVESGLYKDELLIDSPQDREIRVQGHKGTLLNFCANNYLGLANNSEVKQAAVKSIEDWGYGLASVPFICGTQTIHKELERKFSEFLKMEDTILYSSCEAANAGLFEVILGFDVIISDQLCHATIIDGARLWQVVNKKKLEQGQVVLPEIRVFKHSDMTDLDKHLQETQDRRLRLIAVDGVFSMDGDIAPLREICDLAEKYRALVMVDDSHATGFFGPTGRGTPEYWGVMDRVDIITSTMGKGLGGAVGGFTSSRKEIIELLRQRSRPRLFSNAVPPVVVAATIKILDMLGGTTVLRDRLEENATYFRKGISRLGFDIRPGVHPIIPVMLYDAQKAAAMAKRLVEEGIYVRAFSFPVVPRGQARIRVQISAMHTRKDLDFALEKFAKVGRELGIIK